MLSFGRLRQQQARVSKGNDAKLFVRPHSLEVAVDMMLRLIYVPFYVVAVCVYGFCVFYIQKAPVGTGWGECGNVETGNLEVCGGHYTGNGECPSSPTPRLARPNSVVVPEW